MRMALQIKNDSYVWPDDDLSVIPDWVYTDPAVYEREVERIFHGPTWNYVALEAEIPNPGDYVRSNVGPTPVVVARARDGSINAFENRCVHRAAEFCRELSGTANEFVCPYHQWTYDLKGSLIGVPFRRGVNGKGGMPADFKMQDHHPRKLAVTTHRGVVFASYSDTMESFADYLGPEVLREFEATFDGRKLRVLGHYRHSLPGNWKLYHENLKDPYHATLLHSFLVNFGLLVVGNRSQMLADKSGRHGVMASAKADTKAISGDAKKEMRAFKEGMSLNEKRFMNFIEEFDSPWSVTMSTIWPNLIVQREMNTLGVRQIVPTGPNEFIMKWTMFGFEGDDEEMTRHRLRQGNLMGPAGFLGLEDNEAIKFVQDGMQHVPNGRHLVKLDPAQKAGTADTLISESVIRAMYQHWREAMDL
jgi:anthranilate 1,2-dioxygenase large subunit